MKINLVINNENSALKGYANISPLLDKKGFNKGNVHNLDWVADPASVTHLIADDVLSRFTFPEIDGILQNWLGKLALNGSITLRGIDFEEVARALILEQISIQEAAKLIYGDQKSPEDIRCSSMSILDVVAYLEQHGLQITRKVFEGYQYTVEAVRKG